MCSQFLKRMENYQGDLTDILRASGSKTAAEAAAAAALAEWQFPGSTVTFPTDPVDVFGDPFSHLRDPLLLHHGIDAAPVASGLFLHHSDQETNTGNSSGSGFADSISDHHDRVLGDGMMKRPSNNMFSRMLQIAPSAKLPLPPPCDSQAAASPRGLLKVAPPMLLPNDHTLISSNSSKSCLVESPGLQISSPRNTGIRRRKSQAKKVICVPAPAPANSRSSGEIVPSDLWAWRKYGQKPIKGSPYPRGYYRCSSSKGCSARKQVERSRTDPNMLVITYTSEHNHPWPTQRNALAGSTRSQPSASKNNNASSASNSQKCRNVKDHQQQEDDRKLEEETTVAAAAASAVKEEEMEQDFDESHNHYLEFDDQGFSHNSYRPTLPSDAAHHSEDSFFADLGEIESDSLDMLLTQGFSGDDDGGDISKSLDPFSFYDWASSAGNNMSTTTTTSPTTSPAAAATSDAGANKNDSS